ncbi:hypothetical protein UC34_10065 [Pandoraea vervacti]|uniref:Methyltransferase type 11 domain-containing protein n=1 Tax=Pandoraea vervacti TaxID=656178 RepID=A0ABN4FYG4_9BURK|nr:hypothetical protein [Pandoraea vervacti]AJP57257.2 hypothetical protein UC34_10065 [Pandoraea vervacti]
MKEWLELVRRQIAAKAPDLLEIFETYANEALFARRYLDQDLSGLAQGAEVLEVGAGAYLLSCQLVREGFRVSALEPVGQGFSLFTKFQEMVLFVARQANCVPTIIASPGESLDIVNRFDFAFSINVMEHVSDVGCVVDRVGRSLRDGASYRFTCPNYTFPYEPHFNIPTLFSKRLTERLMHRRIFEYDNLPDPAGTWRSLNWITVGTIERATRAHPELKVRFNRDMLTDTFIRVTSDPIFAARRSPLMRHLITALVRSGLHRLPSFLPAAALPTIDCRIQKIVNLGSTRQ